MISFSVINILSAELYSFSSILEVFAINFGTRSTVLPGVFTFHYYEFFSARGFTDFAHIRGVNIFVPPPGHFSGDSRLPVLGLMLGDD